jgi:alpha-ribazole phosphatase
MTIYLIRHGKTEANEKHLYCGSTDLPLSNVGRAELKGLK